MTFCPRITTAIKNLAYDNGAVNCLVSEEQVIGNVFFALGTRFEFSDLQRVEDHFGTLSDEALHELCCAEYATLSPDATADELLADQMLEFIFESLP